MHEGGQQDREQDDGGGAPRGTPQRARQCGEGVAARSPDRSWASRSSVRSKSHAATHSDKDRQQHAREAAAQDAQETEAQEDREPEDGCDDVSDGFTTSEDEAVLTVDRSIKLRIPSELMMMTGEDFERHFLGTQ